MQSCFGSRDAAHVINSLADESRFLRACAAKMVAHICDDEQAVTALLTTPDYLRSRLLYSLVKERRAVIDLYLRRVAASGDDVRLLAALPFGSPDLVREHLPALLPLFGAEDWRLSRLHPDLLAAMLARQATDEAEPEPQLRRRVKSALPLLVKRDPDAALVLVEAVAERLSLLALDLQALAQARSEQVAQLALRQENPATAGIKFHKIGADIIGRQVSAQGTHLPPN